MPRKPLNSPDAIYEVLKERCFIDNDGILLLWANKVWNDAFDAMKGTMSKAYIYLYLSQKRGDVYNRIHGIKTLNSTKDESNRDLGANDLKNDWNWSMGETNCILPALRKSVSIQKSEWDTLKSQVVEYACREYKVLVIGWTDALYDILWSHLLCSFSFKNATIIRNPGEIFLSNKGRCSECKSQIPIALRN